MKFTPKPPPINATPASSSRGIAPFSITQAKEITTDNQEAAIELCLLIEDKHGTQMTLTQVINRHQAEKDGFFSQLMECLGLSADYHKGEINAECLVHRGGFVQLSMAPTATPPRVQILRYFPAADYS